MFLKFSWQRVDAIRLVWGQWHSWSGWRTWPDKTSMPRLSQICRCSHLAFCTSQIWGQNLMFFYIGTTHSSPISVLAWKRDKLAWNFRYDLHHHPLDIPTKLTLSKARSIVEVSNPKSKQHLKPIQLQGYFFSSQISRLRTEDTCFWLTIEVGIWRNAPWVLDIDVVMVGHRQGGSFPAFWIWLLQIDDFNGFYRQFF